MSRRIIVHSLEQARAAVAAAAALGRPVILESAAGAGGYAGPLWFKAIIREAQRSYPEAAVTALLDCAAEAGTAMGALRAGIARVRFTGDAETRHRLDEIAEAQGATVEGTSAEPALDLLSAPDPEASARAFLTGSEGAG